MKKTITVLIVIAVIAAVLFRLASLRNSMPKNVGAQTHITTMPAAVNVTTAAKMTPNHTLTLTGKLTPWKDITVVSEAQGKIVTLRVETGETKSKGNLLASIDNTLKSLAVDNAKVNVGKLQNDLSRTENLFRGGTVSQQQLDDARYAYENSKIQLEQAQKQLEDATITAPISGIITRKYAEEGAFINVGGPIASMVDVSKLKVRLLVSETNVYRLRTGDTVSIGADVYPGVVFSGRITFISSQSDDAHGYPVEITMDNSARYPLKAGTMVNVTIDVNSTGMKLFIPRKALQGGTKDASVYIVKNGAALQKQVVTGEGDNDYIEIVSGISEGDSVVVTGQVNLSEGKPVSIVK